MRGLWIRCYTIAEVKECSPRITEGWYSEENEESDEKELLDISIVLFLYDCPEITVANKTHKMCRQHFQ